MLSTNPKLKYSLIILLIFLSFSPLYGQRGEIDTTDYLPYYFDEAINFNLIYAASKGYNTEIERLIKKGAKVDAETIEGATPLIYAVANNHLEAVRSLLAYGPDVNKATENFNTPLLLSTKNQNVEISEALIRAGADINKTDQYGAAPLHYAVIYGGFYVTDLLLYYQADCNLKANDGTTPLMAAIWAGYADIADLLIQNGANMEARDKQGFTPFLIAAQNGDTLMMNVLLRYGVDLYEKNAYRYNALNIAIESNHMPAVEMLLSRGDKWNSEEKAGINPYRIASAYGRKEYIQMLEDKNIPGKMRPAINDMAVSVSSRFTMGDFFTGICLTFKEPLTQWGFMAGSDIKPWYTRVLIKDSETLFYQYRDRSAMVYAGIFRDFRLAGDDMKSKLLFSASLSTGYAFGNKLKGTNIAPDSKFKLNPAVGIKFQKGHFILSTGLEYLKSEYYRVGPLWLRTGLAYNLRFRTAKAPGKTIKWY
jgi:ankyrin repeat protein